MVRIPIVVTAWLAVTAGAALAQAPVPPVDCKVAASVTEKAWCTAEDLRQAEEELSTTLKAVLAEIDKTTLVKQAQIRGWKSDIRDAQRHWLAWREKDCGAVVAWEMFGAVEMPTGVIGCKARLTFERARDLKRRYLAK